MQVGRIGGYSAYQQPKINRASPPVSAPVMGNLIDLDIEIRPPSPDLSPGSPPNLDNNVAIRSSVMFDDNNLVTEFGKNDPPIAINQQKYIDYLNDQLERSHKLIRKLEQQHAQMIERSVAIAASTTARAPAPAVVQRAAPVAATTVQTNPGEKPRNYYFPTIASRVNKSSGWKTLAKFGAVGALIGFGCMALNPIAGAIIVGVCGAIAMLGTVLHEDKTIPAHTNCVRANDTIKYCVNNRKASIDLSDFDIAKLPDYLLTNRNLTHIYVSHATRKRLGPMFGNAHLVTR